MRTVNHLRDRLLGPLPPRPAPDRYGLSRRVGCTRLVGRSSRSTEFRPMSTGTAATSGGADIAENSREQRSSQLRRRRDWDCDHSRLMRGSRRKQTCTRPTFCDDIERRSQIRFRHLPQSRRWRRKLRSNFLDVLGVFIRLMRSNAENAERRFRCWYIEPASPTTLRRQRL
jgi:hypothetical protein